ncbi:MAG: amidase [Rhodospirillaceae bacterium]|nr:amidase [Rhodospirillaceae bacterium]|tara:strand:+ start:6237 stop:7631 length:1395 start_codon:yes stop_codon:yes gene_type:complete
MNDMVIFSMSASELEREYSSRNLSPVEVVDQIISRIEEVNPNLNAFHHILEREARSAAKVSESRWLKQEPLGPLDGVPTAIKDGLLMKNIPSYRGSVANAADSQTWDINAPVVDRLLENGAIILGKTTMCDYGMLASGYSSKFGPTRNPWNLDYNSGGSSSGSAAAVAAGMCPVVVGTDIVGSIRNPASFCGLYGHKPSFGRVPFFPQTSPAVCAGPIARSVEDAALLLNVISAPDSRDSTALPYDAVDYTEAIKGDLKNLKIGYMPNIGFGPTPDAEVLKLCSDGVKLFRKMGAQVADIEPPFNHEDIVKGENFYRTRTLAELDLLAPEVQAEAAVIHGWAEKARDYTGIDHYRDYLGTQELRSKMFEAIRGVDLLLLPTVPIPPYAADNPGLDDGDIFSPWCNTFVFNLTQQPASSVPCGRTAAGLPVGLQIVGQTHDDIGVLRAAKAFESTGMYRLEIPEL